MNTNGLAKHYDRLTPFERGRLYLAALDRKDTVERQRVLRAAGSLVRVFPDHAPYADAFCDLAEEFFMELLETAACFNDALTCGAGEMDDLILLLTGFVLRARAAGWRLFCERLGFPPFVFWKDYPSFERLERAVKLTEHATFTPAEFLRTLNRPEFLRLLNRPPLARPGPGGTPEGVATALEGRYREWVCLHGGSCPPSGCRDAGGLPAAADLRALQTPGG